jgi:hypothetical protein
MKRYIALFVSLLLVFSTGPVSAGFLDSLKGLIPGHHAERSKPEVTHHGHRARPGGNKQDQAEESPSPNPEESPTQGQSPAPSPVVVQTPEQNADGNQSAGADQSPKPVASPILMQNSVTDAQGASVDIDPPPLY